LACSFEQSRIKNGSSALVFQFKSEIDVVSQTSEFRGGKYKFSDSVSEELFVFLGSGFKFLEQEVFSMNVMVAKSMI